MAIYLDVIILLNFFLFIINFLTTTILLNLKKNFITHLLASLFLTLFVFLIYLPNYYSLVFFSILILINKKIYQKKWIKALGCFLISYIIMLNVIINYSKLSFIKNGYLVVSLGFDWLFFFFISLIVLLIYLGHMYHYKDDLVINKLLYPTIIKKEEKTIEVLGFMDTGNECMYQSNYVVFLRKELLFNYTPEIAINYSNVNSQGIVPGIIADEVIINKKQYNNVVIGIVDKLPYECLLNRKMISWG